MSDENENKPSELESPAVDQPNENPEGASDVEAAEAAETATPEAAADTAANDTAANDTAAAEGASADDTADASTAEATPADASDQAAEAAAKARPPKPKKAPLPPFEIPKIPDEIDPRPFLVLTVVLDSSARAAAVTRSHGDAMERAIAAAYGADTAGLEIVELPIQPHSFAILRKTLGMPPNTVGLYDVFPLASHLPREVRAVAGQFLAAEALWTLEEQGVLGGVPLNVKLDVPRGWSADPKKLHATLVQAGAVELTEQGIETFKQVKIAFDATANQPPTIADSAVAEEATADTEATSTEAVTDAN